MKENLYSPNLAHANSLNPINRSYYEVTAVTAIEDDD
jgi:hypothetical protein